MSSITFTNLGSRGSMLEEYGWCQSELAHYCLDQRPKRKILVCGTQKERELCLLSVLRRLLSLLIAVERQIDRPPRRFYDAEYAGLRPQFYLKIFYRSRCTYRISMPLDRHSS